MSLEEAGISTSKGGGRAFTFWGKSDSVETSGD